MDSEIVGQNISYSNCFRFLFLLDTKFLTPVEELNDLLDLNPTQIQKE